MGVEGRTGMLGYVMGGTENSGRHKVFPQGQIRERGVGACPRWG